MAEEAIDMADEAIEVIDVVDLTHSESDPPTPPTTFKMWLDICPMAKPSVRYGPGRGGHFRVFYDMGVTQAMADLRNTVQDENDKSWNGGISEISTTLPQDLVFHEEAQV